MINSTDIGYVFSKDELLFLASLLGNEVIYGMDENKSLSILDKEEIANRWVEVRASLEKKGYILAEKEEIKVDRFIAKMLNICCKPKAIVNFLYSHSKETIINIFFSEDLIVSKELTNNHKYVITPIENNLGVMTKISDVIDYTPISSDKNNEEIKFNKIDYYRFMAAINLKDIKKTSDLLMKKGMQPDISEKVSRAFIEKDNYILMCCYSNIDNYLEVVESIIFIYVDNQLYSVISDLAEDAVMVIRRIYGREYEDIIGSLLSKSAK